jgi:hypothetical protein
VSTAGSRLSPFRAPPLPPRRASTSASTLLLLQRRPRSRRLSHRLRRMRPMRPTRIPVRSVPIRISGAVIPAECARRPPCARFSLILMHGLLCPPTSTRMPPRMRIPRIRSPPLTQRGHSTPRARSSLSTIIKIRIIMKTQTRRCVPILPPPSRAYLPFPPPPR